MSWQFVTYLVLIGAPLWFLGIAVWRLGTRIFEIKIEHEHHFDDDPEDETETWKYPDSV